MPRILTIAALLPALGASTAALAQAAPWAPPQAQAPYPPAAYDRQLSWPGRAQVHPCLLYTSELPTIYSV